MQISKDLFQPNENFETESSVTKFICISNLPTKDVYVCFFSFKTGKEHKSIDILLFQTNPACCLSRRSCKCFLSADFEVPKRFPKTYRLGTCE